MKNEIKANEYVGIMNRIKTITNIYYQYNEELKEYQKDKDKELSFKEMIIFLKLENQTLINLLHREIDNYVEKYEDNPKLRDLLNVKLSIFLNNPDKSQNLNLDEELSNIPSLQSILLSLMTIRDLIIKNKLKIEYLQEINKEFPILMNKAVQYENYFKKQQHKKVKKQKYNNYPTTSEEL